MAKIIDLSPQHKKNSDGIAQLEVSGHSYFTTLLFHDAEGGLEIRLSNVAVYELHKELGKIQSDNFPEGISGNPASALAVLK